MKIIQGIFATLATWVVILVIMCLGGITHLVYAAISTTNLGDGTTRLRADYIIPSTSVVDVRDDICRGLGWTTSVTCTQAMVNAVPAQCTSGQLNTPVPNPETCINRIDREIRTHLRDLRRAGELKEVEDALVAPVRAADKSGDLQ
jgi:hypothetical protein